MNCINDPALLAGFSAILVDKVMAGSTKRGKKAVVAKVAPNPTRLMMDILTLRLLAFLTHGMQCQVGFFYLCILLVFTLALGGCIPQPSAAFEAIGPFQWSF
jgi:hypothetical protein